MVSQSGEYLGGDQEGVGTEMTAARVESHACQAALPPFLSARSPETAAYDRPFFAPGRTLRVLDPSMDRAVLHGTLSTESKMANP